MSANKNALGTNFAELDAHIVQSEEYDDIPELDDAWFDTAVLMLNGKPVEPSELHSGRKMQSPCGWITRW